jgi:hypothetical protein
VYFRTLENNEIELGSEIRQPQQPQPQQQAPQPVIVQSQPQPAMSDSQRQQQVAPLKQGKQNTFKVLIILIFFCCRFSTANAAVL